MGPTSCSTRGRGLTPTRHSSDASDDCHRPELTELFRNNRYPELAVPVSAAGYTQMLTAAYTAIKAANPDAAVLVGSLIATTDVSGISVTPQRFLAQMNEAGAGGGASTHCLIIPTTSRCRSRRAQALSTRVLRRGLQRGGDQVLDLLITDHSRAARARLVKQPVETELTNWLRHLRTVLRSTSSRSATSTLVRPSLAAITIRARNAKPAALARRRVHPSNLARSASVNTISAACGDGIAQSNKRDRIIDSRR